MRPTYVSVFSAKAMAPWYTTSLTKHSPFKGHLIGSLQLQNLGGVFLQVGCFRMALLCPSMMFFMLGEQLRRSLKQLTKYYPKSHQTRKPSKKQNLPPYQEALQKSGYSYTLIFTPPQQQSPESTNNKRKRQRNIIWLTHHSVKMCKLTLEENF